jgi:hypothetical protein
MAQSQSRYKYVNTRQSRKRSRKEPGTSLAMGQHGRQRPRTTVLQVQSITATQPTRTHHWIRQWC